MNKQGQGQRITSSKWIKGMVGFAILLGLLNGTIFSQSSFAAGEEAYTEQEEAVQNKKLISEEQALQRTAKLFPGLLEAGENELSVKLDEEDETKPKWNINWKQSSTSNQYVTSVQVNALNGQIIDYFNTLHAAAKSIYPLKATLEHADGKAKHFIAKMIPGIKESDLILESEDTQFSKSSLFYPAYYSLNYHLVINGFSSDEESVNVIINGNGDVVAFSAYLTDAVYPKPDLRVTKQQAEDKFKDEVELELFYIPTYDENYNYDNPLKSDYRMAYGDKSNAAPYIDARTGEKLGRWSNGNTEGKIIYSELKSSASPFKQPESGTLSEDQALAAILSRISIPPDATRGNAAYQDEWYGGDHSVWELNWQLQKEAALQKEMTAAVDAETGQLLAFYSNIRESENDTELAAKQPSISMQTAKQKAIDLVTGVFLDAAKYLRIESDVFVYTDNGQTFYTFYFNQVYNGAPVGDSYARVTMDGDGYLWEYIRSYVDPEKLEKKISTLKQNVTQDKALSVLQNAISADLIYINQRISDAAGENETAVKLVYEALINKSNDDHIVNAVTGELELAYNETQLPVIETISKPTDIDKHWASNQLGMMIEYGVLEADEDGKLYPDSTITVGDWIAMLERVVHGNSDNYGSLPFDIERDFGGLEEDEPEDDYPVFTYEQEWLKVYKNEESEFFEQTLTRDQLSLMLVQMLDYDKLSVFMNKDKDITSLKDASSIQNKGAAALAIKLGLLTSSGGKFHPNAPVTKAQASVLLIRLANLQDKLDTPLI
ncbi:YcdB/YcdC domain-containing protein [Paenibacillus sp. 2TAB23]|uniref:PepSY domain-containing protein n=1 Tax=Paenibacillus sp. 2TAB23 TaxID=3233004 RepID=UPI003F94551C